VAQRKQMFDVIITDPSDEIGKNREEENERERGRGGGVQSKAVQLFKFTVTGVDEKKVKEKMPR